MIRTIASGLTAATISVLAVTGPPAAQAQKHMSPIVLDQSLVDRWLLAMPAMIKLGTSSSTPQTDDAVRPQVERICSEAGFDSYDQCGEVIGYVGMIVSACDRRARTFRDPIVLMRRQIARIESDMSLSPEERDKATAELKEIVARFPENLPQTHIRLMTANRDRVFAALASSAK